MSVLVYRYGLLSPVAGGAEVERQMRAAHDLRNDLTAIERGRRAELRARTSVGEVERLETEVTALREVEAEAARAIKAARAATRSRSDTTTMRDALVTARAESRAARARLFAARTAARDVSVTIEVESVASALRKDAYRLLQQERGINWGARWLAEMATDAARDKLPHLFERDGVSPMDPKFRRWSGDGQITVQLMGESSDHDAPRGLASADLAGDDTRLRIGPYVTVARRESPARARWRASGDPRLIAMADRDRNGTPDALRALWIRVGSHPDRSPVWAVFPLKMHRPLPARSVIKRATVSRRMRGPREEWSVEITIDTSLSPRSDACGVGAVAINFGWRVVDSGLRVATWKGEDGDAGELVLADDVIGAIRKPEDLREIRDRAFNVARAALVTWLAGRELSEWMGEATRTLADWRSPGRLAALCLRWAKTRLEGDDDGFAALEKWRYHDRHLWTWECDQRTSALRYRRDVYRKFAAQLARHYSTVVVEDFDLSTIARHEPVESTTPEIAPARSNRFLAAVGELRTHIEHAFRSRGGIAEKVSASYTTATCHACGNVEEFDAITQIHHACRACGVVWDQDENAATNILARYRERPDDGPDLGTARTAKSKGKWAKRKEKKAERATENGGARESPANAAE